ncbi:hypothetical protein HPB50_005623 [Hyalomma asiaticum]|uniref:Uncharacterized protein n=1 Tax=Hyalomma asiaticum TaxID=266040 RepID=A0ACB7RUV1_HYAAI|nr:hypothetical protein HPB50_005623 [Hyalomma asiaticum]
MAVDQAPAPDDANPAIDVDVADGLSRDCTRSDDQVCQVLSHLAAPNRVLWHLGLQLREDPRDGVGELSIVQVPGINHETQRIASHAQAQTFATNVLHQLLEKHRCIVAVEVNDAVAKTDSLLRTLAAAPCVRRLTIAKTLSNGPISDLEAWLTASFELTGKRKLLCREDTSPLGAALNAADILLQRTDRGLQALDLAALDVMDHGLRRRIVSALQRSHTITELSVPYSVVTCTRKTPFKQETPFVGYLAREDSTLRKLTIKHHHSDKTYRPLLGPLIRALSNMSTLEELNLEVHLSMHERERFAMVLVESQSLRRFSLLYGQCCQELPYEQDERPVTTYLELELWIWALRQAGSLRKLTMDMSWCSSVQCAVLIHTIAHHNVINDTTMLNVPTSSGLGIICLALFNVEPPRKVFVNTYNIAPVVVYTMVRCPLVTSVAFCGNRFLTSFHLADTVGQLVACDHITTLCLNVDYFVEHLYARIEFCVRTMSSLRDLELCLFATSLYAGDDRRLEWEGAIVEAASANHNLAKLTLKTGPLTDEHYRRLADGVLDNQRLRELSVTVLCERFCDVFLGHLLPGLRHNYNIVRLHLEQRPGGELSERMAIAQNIVRRNGSIERRAVMFVMGDRDPYCGRVVELAAERPDFVETVAREADVSVAEAASMVASPLNLLRGVKMEDFMILTGVVKRTVSFDSSDDRTNLSHLNYDCWRHISQYLKPTDVLTDF